jgi:cell division initiation protein
MKITPMEIHQKRFTKKMMGYDTKEVENFLSEIATNLEQIISERNSLREAIREKELQLAEYKEREQTLQNTIQTAAVMAEKMREDALREAKLILNDANQKAEVIVRDAKENLRKMYTEIADLKRIRMQFESSFKALMNAHLSLIDEGSKVFQTYDSNQASNSLDI